MFLRKTIHDMNLTEFTEELLKLLLFNLEIKIFYNYRKTYLFLKGNLENFYLSQKLLRSSQLLEPHPGETCLSFL